MNEETLYRFASNSIEKQDEIEKILNWIDASPGNRKEFSRIKNQWAYAGYANFEELANQIKPDKRTVARVLILKWGRYAAVFILAFLIGAASLHLFDSANDQLAMNEVIVPLGETTELHLSDGTHVWLNSGARLSYPSEFEKKSREVKLEGEAYFEVTHNAKKPFHVQTRELVVNVLGTSFNVEAHKDSKYVSVTLVEGKVNLENRDGKLLSVLSPEQNARFNIEQKNIEISPVNTCFYTSWKDGSMSFKDEKLADIAAKLERWYNVSIVFDDESVANYRFSGSVLKNKPVDQILEILKFTAHIDYSIEINNQAPNSIHLKKLPMIK